MTEVEACAGLAVRGADALPGAAAFRAALVRDGVPGRLMAKDPTLWGPGVENEAKDRLGWVDAFRTSRTLLPVLASLRAELTEQTGLEHVVLAGMGGSSLAAEVIARTLGRELTVLDTTDPGLVRAALADRLTRTAVVVSSKSGSTVETDAHRRTYWQALCDAGVPQPGRRIVVVTDPGSPLVAAAQDMGAHLVLADPGVGGRYSALTAFGLVPAALLGIDVTALLDQAELVQAGLAGDTDNPALALAAGLVAAARGGRDRIALVDDGTGITGLGDWVEQLIAESTGKDGVGLLPVVVANPGEAGATGPDVLTVTLGGALPPGAVPGSGVLPHVSVNGPLGAQFLVWEAAIAMTSRLLGANPFDQPNVAESKDHTARLLSRPTAGAAPSAVHGPIEIYLGSASGGAGGSGAATVTTLEEALVWLLGQLPADGYLAVLTYLDQIKDRPIAAVRPALAHATGRVVTFGWGPRYLHSTGQYHKGGPRVGAFLQLTGVVEADLAVPGRPYTFGELQAAQAAGEWQALASRGRPQLRLHLTDRSAGAAMLLEAVGSLARSTVMA